MYTVGTSQSSFWSAPFQICPTICAEAGHFGSGLVKVSRMLFQFFKVLTGTAVILFVSTTDGSRSPIDSQQS